ncbi:MAG TPA: DegT/DnrJ/EryC1/StrS family aminotransferase, partial [Bacillota bacterium]|nr:DegT/DnrJ/EryC1/StrS family aminotransferase [Bacillota bacterium]HOL11210.1 DegT/DnrJ/EryC1/StrS family aminotransferase [Bacillota bacterium]
MNQWIAVNEPLLIGNELQYLEECIKTGWISSEGPFVKCFEAEFAARIGQTYGVAVANGSAALDLAMLALDLEPGAEVIMPTFTIISCAAAILRAGAIPVLVDADPLTWNMDVSQIEAKITARTKAIMVVHIYGLPVDLDPVLKIAAKYGLAIIEDAAEAIGQTYRGKPCGSFGDLSVFSFYANKHITTGEGGMIVTSNPIYAERCCSLRNLCFKPERRFVHDQLGYNYRLTNIQAALGLAQLERLDQIIELKRAIGNQYQVLLSDLAEVQQPLAKTEYADNIYWVYGLVLRDCCSQSV